MRRGRGFSYQNPDGTPVTDAATLQRIKDLVIPPAWKKVWICFYPNGHIQAVGDDAAGRRQYLYHQKWQQERNEEKFDRVLEMSAVLPDMRRRIAADLRRRGLDRDRVVALACTSSTSATSGRAASSTRRTTTRTASPRCCANTSCCRSRPSSSTTPPRAACAERC